MFYNAEQFKKLSKNTSLHLWICIPCFLIVATLITVSCFYINDSTVKWITAVDCIILSLYGVYLTYLIINIFIPNYRKKMLINNLLISSETTFEYTKFEVGKIRTMNHSEKVFEIYLSTANEEHYVYLDTFMEDKLSLLEKGHAVKVRQNYITEIVYEENN